MLMFFSGDTSVDTYPENVLKCEKHVGVMLTYWDVVLKGTVKKRLLNLIQEKEQVPE